MKEKHLAIEEKIFIIVLFLLSAIFIIAPIFFVRPEFTLFEELGQIDTLDVWSYSAVSVIKHAETKKFELRWGEQGRNFFYEKKQKNGEGKKEKMTPEEVRVLKKLPKKQRYK